MPRSQRASRAKSRSVHFSGEALERRVLMSSGASPTLYPLADLMGARGLAKAAGAVADKLYDAIGGLGIAANGASASLSARSMTPFKLNFRALRETLATAPMEFTSAAGTAPAIVPIPMPNGSFAYFKVVEAPIMEAALAAQFPDIKTYRGVGIDDPTASVRIDYSPLGFHAQVLSTKGSYYIDPYYLNDAQGTYTSYFKRDAVKRTDWVCDVEDGDLTPAQERTLDSMTADATSIVDTPLDVAAYGSDLRTYRAAVAADGEYVAAVGGGTVAGGQAAVVTAMNRVSGIYETELAIRMVLVANNSSLIYTNAATDPYTNNDPSTLLTENQANITSVIGSANYDIGHVFTTGGGGLAGLGVVGSSTNKSRGETGLPTPTGDAFYVDYVAHEMGHQFGGNHTFNTAFDLGNRNASTAYEPGSGSTIMAYAGLEGSDNLQSNSDPYFLWASIDEIRNYVTGSIPGVGTVTTNGNSAPVLTALTAYTIPTQTPFALTASATDANGDTITYSWEERDKGAATNLSTADNGASPLFRAFPPTTNPTRTFPRLSNLLANTTAAGEKLPTVARPAFKWRVVARDSRTLGVGGGGVSSQDVSLVVVNTGAAFAVTAPNTALTWTGGSAQNVTWDVAGTTANGINTANVNILLSTDGGNTFPTNLTPGGTPNDGTQSITAPFNTGSTTARIKVEAIGNIFFDLSNTNFTITNVAGATAAPGLPVLISETGTSNSDGIVNLNNTVTKKLTFNVPSTVNGAAVTLYAGATVIGTGTGNGGTLQIITNGTATIPDGVGISITAKQQLSPAALSAASPALGITVDTLRPTAATVFASGASQNITVVYSEDLQASITNSGAATLTVPGVSSANMAVSYTAGTKTAVYTFPGLANQKLSDGAYTVTPVATDVAGNTPSTGALSFIYGGGTAAHTFYLRTNSGASTIEVYKNTAPDGSPDITATNGVPTQIIFDGSNLDDAVTIDYSLGNPVPAGAIGFAFNGAIGNDTLNLIGGNTFTFYSDASPATVNLTVNTNSTNVLFNTTQHLAALSLSNGGNGVLLAGGARVLVTGSLAMGAATLNLNDNDMVVHTGSELAIDGLVFNGKLFSSLATSQTTLGVADSGEVLGNVGTKLFSGETVTASDILVKYTYAGDANLNGAITADDYAFIDLYSNTPGSAGYWHGDFNHDGAINADDYALIDLNFLNPGPLL